ncbi:hypothetical protein [Streptomyces sp. NPDC008317]|uniref:hypothetical protein n=1 Tax=Streptomyces sp. NPDC008317 TaxID=3364827 RepID=UPI0036ED1A11
MTGAEDDDTAAALTDQAVQGILSALAGCLQAAHRQALAPQCPTRIRDCLPGRQSTVRRAPATTPTLAAA